MVEIASELMTRWEPLRPLLDLTRPHEEIIRRSYPNYQMQKIKMLEKWKEKKGDQATYAALITATKRAGNMHLADAVRKMKEPS